MKIIFVCSGNTCRSPMAEGYLKSFHLKDTCVLSRGFCLGGDRVSENSALVMAELGIDIKNHISTGINNRDLDADFFICMTPSHAAALISAGVEKNKVLVLGDGISDPFMKDIEVYRKCRNEIIAAINDLVFGGLLFGTKIIPAKREDLTDIAGIEKECFSVPWSLNSLNESFDSSTLFFIAKENGKTVGYIGVSYAADEFYITNVAVKTKSRQKGIGSLLLNRAIIEAEKQGAAFISLEVRPSNNPAVSLYTTLGFKTEGKRKNYYTNPTEDALIMTRRFTDVNTID